MGRAASTVLLIGHDDSARFIERSFDAGGRATGEVAFDFRVVGSDRPAEGTRPLTGAAP